MFSPKKNVEPKTSRIAWEKADANTKKRIVVALIKQNRISCIASNILFLLMSSFLLFVIGYCINLIIKNPDAIVFYMFGIIPANIILGTLLYKYIKAIPYMYPRRQSNVWIFRTKCFRIGESSRLNPGGPGEHGYFAFFNSKSGQISMLIPYKEYRSNPVGKEYIFYKFNDKTGNIWTNIAADKVDKL